MTGWKYFFLSLWSVRELSQLSKLKLEFINKWTQIKLLCVLRPENNFTMRNFYFFRWIWFLFLYRIHVQNIPTIDDQNVISIRENRWRFNFRDAHFNYSSDFFHRYNAEFTAIKKEVLLKQTEEYSLFFLILLILNGCNLIGIFYFVDFSILLSI